MYAVRAGRENVCEAGQLPARCDYPTSTVSMTCVTTQQPPIASSQAREPARAATARPGVSTTHTRWRYQNGSSVRVKLRT